MKLNRRTLLKLTFSTSLMHLLNPINAFAEQNVLGQTLGAMIETIIPNSNHNEIANDLLIKHTLETNIGKLMLWGSRWLNQNSQALFGQHFTSLTEAQKTHIIKIAEQHKKTVLAYQFFAILRNEAMTMHYTSVQGTNSLAFQTSPQPKGYLNHSLPPINRVDV